jgi:hypothetical protein
MNRLARVKYVEERASMSPATRPLDDGVAVFATAMDDPLAGISTRQEERA